MDAVVAASDITIREVGKGASTAQFMRVPHLTQGHDPYWIAPLPLIEAPRLNPKKHPWFQHGEAAVYR